jgi:hypothetical protein
VPAGTVADVPRKSESLCTLVRSTLKVVALRGILTADPEAGLSEIVFISTTKERRLVKVVLGGGVSGAALNVRLSVAVPPPGGGGEFFAPLHEIRKMVEIESSETRTFRKFMSPHGERLPGPRVAGAEGEASQAQFYAAGCNEQM